MVLFSCFDGLCETINDIFVHMGVHRFMRIG